MTARIFVADTRLQAAPCHAGHYGAAGDAGNVIEIGEAVAIRMRSKIRQAARDEAVSLLKSCIGGRITKAELAALLDASWKEVFKMLRGHTPFPAEAFVLVALRRPDLAVEVVVSYVSLLSDACLDTVIARLVAVREERRAKKPS